MNLLLDLSPKKDPDQPCDHYPCDCLDCEMKYIKDCIVCGEPIIEMHGRWHSLATEH